MYEYFGLKLETQKIFKNLKMSFNGQPNMFFDNIISYTCDFHLKLNILNPLNKFFLLNGFLNASFALQPFLSKFQNFDIFVWISFSLNASSEHVFS